jgi:putative flippase GtrA
VAPEPQVVAPEGPVARVRALLGSEGVRFVLVGGVNSVFGFLVFAGLQATLGLHVHYLVVLAVAQVIAVFEAYVMQRWLVFRAVGRWWRDLVRFAMVYTGALVANFVALPFLVEVLHVPVTPAQGIVMVATALGSFLVHRSFTFRHSRGAARGGPPVEAAPQEPR